MNTYEDAAIDAARDFLIDLLARREWCQAKAVGRALEMLINNRRPDSVLGTVVGNSRPQGYGASCEKAREIG